MRVIGSSARSDREDRPRAYSGGKLSFFWRQTITLSLDHIGSTPLRAALLTRLLDARRPHRVDAARNFDAILLAARECFTETGIDASLEEIAKQAGVGVATLYRNFPTREDLVEVVYVTEVAAVCAHAQVVVGLDPLPALHAWFTRFVTYLNTKRALLEGLNRDSTAFRACRDALYQTAEPLLARAQTSGAVAHDIEIDDLMRLVFAITGGIYRDDGQRDRVLELSLRGIQTNPDGSS